MSKERLDSDKNPGHLSFERMSKGWEGLVGNTIGTIKQDVLNQQIPELRKFNTGLGTSALNVFDMEENKFLHVDEQIEEVTGIPREDYFSKGPSYLLTKASFTHIPKLISSTLHQRKFLANRSIETIENYIINREFAYAHSGTKRWVLHQTIRHLTNAQGNIFAAAVLQTRIDGVKLDNKFRYYIFDRQSNKIVYPKPAQSETVAVDQLSDRERDIVNLLVVGKSNKEIAQVLHISFHTVRTHRKNIFRKLGCSNLIELLQRL